MRPSDCATAHRQLLDLSDRVGPAVALSTISVYTDGAGRCLDDAVDEASFPDWPVPIPEDWPTVPPGDTGYSARKSAAETLLRDQTGLPVTVLRLGAVHGPHSRHLREWYFIKRALDCRTRVVLPYGSTSVFQTIATINLAEMVALAAAKPGHRRLNCADERPPSVAEISATVDGLMGWSTGAALVSGPPPQPTVGEHPWCVPRAAVADMGSARTSLGYREVVSYSDALSRTLPWVLEACSGRDWRDVFPTLARYPTDLFDYDAEDNYLSALGTSSL